MDDVFSEGVEAAGNKIAGKAKAAAGEVVGNEDLRDEGQAQQDKAEAKGEATKQEAKAEEARTEAEVHEARERAAAESRKSD